MQKWTESPFGVLEAHFLPPSLLPSHSVSITHSSTPSSPSPPPLSALLFIGIARLFSQPWLSRGFGVAPLIFHIPLFLLFGLFPKALWASGGKLLATDYSYTVISPCFAPLFSFFHKSFFLSFHLSFVYPWMSSSLSLLPSLSFLLSLSLVSFSNLAVLSVYPFKNHM